MVDVLRSSRTSTNWTSSKQIDYYDSHLLGAVFCRDAGEHSAGRWLFFCGEEESGRYVDFVLRMEYDTDKKRVTGKRLLQNLRFTINRQSWLLGRLIIF